MIGGGIAVLKNDTFNGHAKLLGGRSIITVIQTAQNLLQSAGKTEKLFCFC
jgi:hypothetical protein